MDDTENKVSLTYFGGANEIGGNKVLLEDFKYDVKIFLDFGVNARKLYDYKREHGNPSTIEELIEIDLMPSEEIVSIDNLYTWHYFLKEGQYYTKKVAECKGKVDPPSNLDGIFISHAHKDHYYGIPFVNRNVPIHAGEITEKIINAYSKSSAVSFENFYYGINWRSFRTGDIIDIKGMKIHPVHVDHSIPAAYGFIISTSAGLIVYPGDFRMHGPLKSMTDDLIEKVKQLSLNEEKIHGNSKVMALICEGTFIHKGSIESEARVKDQLEVLFNDIVFDYFVVKYHRADWDRFRTLVNIAKNHGWKYIISEKDAYFYYVLNQDSQHETMRDPDLIKDDNILILKQKNRNNKLYHWQKEIRQIFERKEKKWRLKNLDDLKEIKSNFFLFYTNLQDPLEEFLPLHLTGAFLASDIDPYAEERYDNTRSLENKLRNLGLPSYRIHASGHAKTHDIYKFVKEIEPQHLLPIHTRYSGLFKKLFKNTDINVIVPKIDAKPFKIIFKAD